MNFLKLAFCTVIMIPVLTGCVKKEPPVQENSQGSEAPLQMSNEVASLNANIKQGLGKLSELKDPNINQIYQAINSLNADSSIEELSKINAMIYQHIEVLQNRTVAPSDQEPASDTNKMLIVNSISNGMKRLQELQDPQLAEIQKTFSGLDEQKATSAQLAQINNIINNRIAEIEGIKKQH